MVLKNNSITTSSKSVEAMRAMPDIRGHPNPELCSPSPPPSARSETSLSTTTSRPGYYTYTGSRPAHESVIMHFMRDHTTIPVPMDIQYGYDNDSKKYYFTYKVPEGEPLEACWGFLSEEERSSIISEIRDYVQQIRRINPTQILNFGCVDRFVGDQRELPCGPYTTTKEYLQAVADRIDRTGKHYDPLATKKAVEFLRELLARDWQDQELVFTHGNLFPGNILIGDNGKVSAVLGWSESGYAPPCWEYVKARLQEFDAEFFIEGGIGKILDPWPLHLAVMIPARDIIW